MIGQTIGNFRIVERIGRGGMGEVWLGTQQALGTNVAIKMLLEPFPPDSEDVVRFFNEARAVGRIQHAGITKIFDSGILPDGRAYLVMEYLEGESLASRILRQRISKAALCDIVRQIASVLDATHSAGITHRDLKPDNIFLIRDREQPRGERVKVLDFGVAKLTGTLAGNSPRTFGTLGTPMYMAPEQWGDASQVDYRADIYSLGCVAYEMACGHPPFPVKTVAEACAKHLNEVPPKLSTQTDGVPPELDRWIAAMLEKAPERRPKSMREIERAFAQLGTQLDLDDGTAPTMANPIATPAPTQKTRWRLPWVAAAAIGVVVIAGVGIMMMGGSSRPAAQPPPPPKPVVTEIAPPVDAAMLARDDIAQKLHEVANVPPPAPPPPAPQKTVHHEPVTPPKKAPPPPQRQVAIQVEQDLPDIPPNDQIGAALLTGEKALDNCMVQNKVTTKQKLEMHISSAGRVTQANVEGELANSEYSACIFTVLRALSFPQSKKGIHVTVPVTPP
ncbi:MAG: protein kinase [Kofleriaceae bacterium]